MRDVGDAIAACLALVVAVSLFVFMLFTACSGKDSGVAKTRQEAIEAGAGEWRIDAKTGEKSFHWIGSTKK